MLRRTALLLPLLLLLTTTSASAATGDHGYDVSWPQCSGTSAVAPPTSPDFAVVGVNHGSAWSTNPCLQAQVTWAAGRPRAAMLYANTANPAPTSSFYWPSSGTSDPAYCADATSTTDPGCAYDYGWHTADDALKKVEALAQGAAYAHSLTWWLDVEVSGPTGNTWNGDGISNAADLQGMVDRLRSAGVPDVGIYAGSTDWGLVSGSGQLGTAAYTRGASSAYRAHWPFTPLYPIEDGPMWFAGLNDESSAIARCAAVSLTGGERLLSQYDVPTADPDVSWDGDYRCADADHAAPTAVMTAPTALISTASTTGIAWHGTDAGSGLASYDLRSETATGGSPFGAWGYLSKRVLGTSASVASPSRGATRCWGARSRDAAGNVSGWSGSRCVITPLDDRDLTASTGWTRTTGASGWFSSSYSSATRLNATLSRSGLQTDRLVLLAYKCPTCGSVEVLLNGSHLTTVSLAASSSYRAQVALPRFSLRTATVTLRVATSGKLVRVDWLATSRV